MIKTIKNSAFEAVLFFIFALLAQLVDPPLRRAIKQKVMGVN